VPHVLNYVPVAVVVLYLFIGGRIISAVHHIHQVKSAAPQQPLLEPPFAVESLTKELIYFCGLFS
jgi:hypothetical protein